MITESAPAKLNLALHIRSRRSDGYHDLETLFAFCADGDVLTVAPARRWSLTIQGPFAPGLAADDQNLVVRAARAFADRFAVPADYAVILDKRLPLASGIGGGSADAAAMLRALARYNEVAIEDRALFDVAAALGSDVPACLLGRTAIGRGRGEDLWDVAGLGGAPALLVNPGVAVSTARVFSAWDGIDRGPLPAGGALAIAKAGRNDLEPPARVVAPAVDSVLAALTANDGLALARMSGSGATCFALFESRAARDAAAARIAAVEPDWWILSTTVD